MKLKHTVKKLIIKELEKVKRDLDVLEIGDLRVKVAYLIQVTEENLKDSESWVDARIADIVESNHTLLLVGVFVTAVFSTGVILGTMV